MGDIALWLGMVLMGTGGALVALAIIFFAGWLVCVAWIAFSTEFRAICKAEGLIFEYRKNREQFLEWKEANNG